MFFSMIRLGKNVSPHDAATLNWGNSYQTHRLIWRFFSDGPDRQRDFLYRHENVSGWPRFYSVSEREPKDIKGTWEVQSKPYFPKLKQGQRLQFTLRANPIRTKRDEDGRQHRHDVIMDKKTYLKNRGKCFHESELIQNQGEQWLLERCESLGFSVTSGGFRADGYRQHRLLKGKTHRIVSLSTVDFNGILTVTDPSAFVTKCLYRGIGPAKAFGCGLMLVRRI